MSQFTINGITFEDDKDSLQHGLGVGGGRGRPKGSRNGYINPNAAYMKNYQVVGEVADYSDPLNTGKRPANPPRERTWAPSPQSPGPTRRITTKEAQKRLIDSFRKQGEYKAAQRPAASVQSGKTLMEKVLKEQSLPEQTIQEQYLTETKPIEVNPVETKPIETKTIENKPEQSEPQAKENSNPLEDAWNGLLDWGKNAWNDLSTAATGAIDTGKGWAKDGLDWVNKNILDPAGDWGSQAISDVGNWIGDRGRELDRWWNGYDVTTSDVTDRYAPAEQHVNGFRENAGNWLGQAARDTGDFLGRAGNAIGTVADRTWNGYTSGDEGDLIRFYHPGLRDYYFGNNERGVSGAFTDPIGFANQQLIEPLLGKNGIDEWTRETGSRIGQGIQNAASTAGQWLGDRGQDLDRWWNGYDTGTNPTETRIQGDIKNDAKNRSTHVPGFRENAATSINNTVEDAGRWLSDRGRDIAALPQNASDFVQREIIDPVTGAARTYLIDPVTNTVVAVADAVRDNVVNPVRGAAQQINQNIVQPAVNAVNDNVVRPVVNAVSEAATTAANAAGNASANEYQYLQGSGDSYSDFARRSGVPTSVVDSINRSAATNNRSYQENLETRAELMQMLGTLSRNGVLSGNEIQRMYSNSQNSPDVLNSLYNEVLNAYMNATPRNSIRNSDR